MNQRKLGLNLTRIALETPKKMRLHEHATPPRATIGDVSPDEHEYERNRGTHPLDSKIISLEP